LGIVGYKPAAEPESQIATDLKEALPEQSSVRYVMGGRINMMKIFEIRSCLCYVDGAVLFSEMICY